MAGRDNRHRRAGIPVADIEGLRAAIRRTTVQRVVLAIAALCFLLAAALTALRLPTKNEILANQRSGMIVLDVSRSINATKMNDIRNLLTHFSAPSQRVGLVFFSDTAYQLLPPGSPGPALQPIVRFFSLHHVSPGSKKLHLIRTPWDDNFRGGTQVSRGLEVARLALRRQGSTGQPILLVSDLDNFTDDLPRVGEEISALRRAHIPLRIYAVDPTANDRQLFVRLAGTRAFLPVQSLGHAALRQAKKAAVPSTVSAVLIGFAVVLLAVLGLNELWCGRLDVPTAAAEDAA
jgi:hypothetical protein